MGLFGFDEQYAMFDVTPVANQFLLEFMPMAKGDYVKVYLYGLMQCHHPQADMSIDQMSRELHLSEEEILTAYRYWERKGLVQRIGDKPPRFRYVNVNKLIFVDGSAAVDTEYEMFAESIYALYGNDYRLHGKQIGMFYEWVEDLHLPVEVVLGLIKHMIDTRGRKFSVESAQKLALEMASAGVQSVEEAEAVLTCDKKVWRGSRDVIEKFNLSRPPTMPEIAMYRKWFVEWGYTPDAILAACDETTNGKQPSFRYLDSILKNKRDQMGQKKITSKQVVKAREERETIVEPLRRLLSAMNIVGVTVNEGTLKAYENMRRLYPDEIILIAGRECAVRGGGLDDVQALLESWKGKKLHTVQDVQAHIHRFDELNKQVQTLYQLWGRENKPTASDRTLMQKWQEEWGFTLEMIIASAAYAREAGRPMTYLNKLLEVFRQQGITTPEGAAASQAQWREKLSAQPEKPQKTGKVVREQQYTQREYEDTNDMPDWMLKRWKEMNGDA